MDTEQKRMRIIFVDDSNYILQSLRRTLWRLNAICDLEFTNTATQALALHRKQHFNVIVTDLDMPIMNGWELLAAMRIVTPEVRCFILSGDQDMTQVEKARERGYGLLEKPCSPQALESAIFGGNNEDGIPGSRQEGERHDRTE